MSSTPTSEEDQIIIIRNIVTGRTQTIAVKHGSHHIAIGKRMDAGPSHGSIIVA